MGVRQTTICCSAVALVAACCVDLASQTPAALRQVKQTRSADDTTPLQLFPVETMWTLALDNVLTAPPAYDGARGYFPFEDDQFAAYNLINGRRLWIATVKTSVQPAAGSGIVLVVEPGAMTALGQADGAVVWQVPFEESLAATPLISGDWLVTAAAGGEIVARRARDGSIVWRRQLGAPAHAQPAMHGDRVFIPTSSPAVVALRRDTGEPLWTTKLGGPGNEILADGDRLFLGSKDGYFYCLNARTGTVEWRWLAGPNVIGKPAVDDESVYFVALDNVLRALNRSSGVQHWKTPLPVRPTTGPLMSSRTIVVVGGTPGIKAYNARDGKPTGQATTPTAVAAPPHLVRDPALPFPILVAVASDITGRVTVTALTRTVEPEIAPMRPLPNVVTMPIPGETP